MDQLQSSDLPVGDVLYSCLFTMRVTMDELSDSLLSCCLLPDLWTDYDLSLAGVPVSSHLEVYSCLGLVLTFAPPHRGRRREEGPVNIAQLLGSAYSE